MKFLDLDKIQLIISYISSDQILGVTDNLTNISLEKLSTAKLSVFLGGLTKVKAKTLLMNIQNITIFT